MEVGDTKNTIPGDNLTENLKDPSHQKFAGDSLEALRKRLLDLTARNRLINFRHAKKGIIRVIDELPNQLHNQLLSEKPLKFLAVREPSEAELLEAGFFGINEETGDKIRIKEDPKAPEWARLLGFDISYELPLVEAREEGKHQDDAYRP